MFYSSRRELMKENSDRKITVFCLADHPLSPSGVGHMTKNMITACLDSGKFRFVCFGGAIKHKDYKPIRTEEYGEDWTIYPVDNYGNPEMVRSVIRTEKPDIMWFMTDPRFWTWLWAMSNEIRPLMPMVYYHVWDNYPYPNFNKAFYDSNDLIVSISKVTDDIVRTVSPKVDCIYLPHAVDTNIFMKRSASAVDKFKRDSFKESDQGDPDGKFIVFWNNRNARRKQSGTLIYWFKEFLEQVGRDKALLIMHTDPKDENGQDLEAIIHNLGLTSGEVMFSRNKMPPEVLSLVYNMADVVVNISDAEGFGLATLESLACETPVIATMTGGLQEQVTDGKQFFGVGIEPSSKAIIGSQQVPYIYEDRLNKHDFLDAMHKLHDMSKEERDKLGAAGREHVLKNYGFKHYRDEWARIMLEVHKKHGSWNTRRGYKAWELRELKAAA